MKTLKLSLFILLVHLSLFSFSQTITFAMDSLIIDRETYNLKFGRNNSFLNISSNELSKTIFVGVLKNDSIHLNLKQSIIQYEAKKIPLLIYKFIFRDMKNSMTDSVEGMYIQFPLSDNYSYHGTFDNLVTVYLKIKGNPDNSMLLANKAPAPTMTFDITHQMDKIKIGKKSFPATSKMNSVNIKSNSKTETVKIGTYKKTDVYYNISVHPLHAFPGYKIICINSDLEKENLNREHINTYLMKGNRAESDKNSFASFNKTLPEKKKPVIIRFKPIYTIDQKN